MDTLPIDPYLPLIEEALANSRAVVVVAPPGAGKTTRVPPALSTAGPVLLLQPRRAAARGVATRIAEERAWSLGHEVGWQIRFERRYRSDTRVLVATEGILTSRLQRDPLLSGFHTLVIDEFHERSIHSDLGLALARQTWLARDDFRLVVMSATLDAEPVAAFLGDCPIVRVPGRTFPIEVEYAPQMNIMTGAIAMLERSAGSVLCFVAGGHDVERAVREISLRHLPVDLFPLHGSLDGRAQDRALAAVSERRRIIVSTNIAETSVTVPGISAVVDSGLHKVARYDRARAIDGLFTERIPRDSADQRAGRAGRTGPGRVLRLWAATDHLRPAREPEIHRIDLAACVLDLVACGEDPEHFSWFERPNAEAIASALALLGRLGAVSGRRLTLVGEQMRQLPLSPRLSRVFIAGGGSRQVVRACAVLGDRFPVMPRGTLTTSDVLSVLDEWHTLPHLQATVDQLERTALRLGISDDSPRARPDDHDLRRAILAGYPDRVARRREPGSERFKLASGSGAALSPESGVRDAEWLVALDVTASNRINDPNARIRVASAIDRDWLSPNGNEARTWLDQNGKVRTAIVARYDSLELSQTPASPDLDAAEPLLKSAFLEEARSSADQRLLRRLAFASCAADERVLIDRAVIGKRALHDVRLSDGLTPDIAARLTRDAPESLVVPSGRSVRLDYASDGSVVAEVKLQELFGLEETPRVGPRREPVVFSLLAPNGRPVQVTRDLKSFWARTYPEVRKELRGRYPKHPWPEDPWNAAPTGRPLKRKN